MKVNGGRSPPNPFVARPPSGRHNGTLKYGTFLTGSVSDTDSGKVGLFDGYDGRLMIAISVGWLGIRLGREVIPPLLPVIIETVDITASTAGFGLTVMWFIYSLSQYPGGRLSDGLSRKTILVGGLAIILVGFLVLSVITTYAGLLIGFALLGLGAGFYFAPSRAVLADLFEHRRGQVFGLMSAAGSVGAAAAAGLSVFALYIGYWQSAFIPVLVLLGAVLVAIHLWQRGEYVVEPVSLEVGPTFRRILKLPRIRWFLVAYILVSFTWQGFLGFLPTFLQVEKGFSPALAGTVYASVFVIAIVVGPLAGQIADIVSRVLVAIIGLGIAVVGFVGMLTIPQTFGVAGGVALIAIGLRAYPPVMQSHLIGLFPDESMAGDFGGIKTIWTGLGSTAPTYVGLVAAQSSYTTAFSGFIGCLLVGAVALLGLYVATDG